MCERAAMLTVQVKALFIEARRSFWRGFFHPASFSLFPAPRTAALQSPPAYPLQWRRLALLGHHLPQAAKGTQFHFGTIASKLGRVWD